MAHSNAPQSARILNDPLEREIIEQIVSGRHGAPFDVLGPHLVQSGGAPVWIVRAFLPGALAANVLPAEEDETGNAENAKKREGRAEEAEREQPQRTQRTQRQKSEQRGTAREAEDTEGEQRASAAAPIPMRQIHPAGLFSMVVPAESVGVDGARAGTPRYTLEVRRPWGVVERMVDPYSLPPQLSEYDLHLFGEGKHHELYERLGAHPTVVNGVPGTLFAVWAPEARRVSVVGDFNGWEERAAPMRLRPGGVWELFLPGVGPGAVYKYAILSWNGNYHVLKADPYAFAAELRPGTASRVWDLSGYQWQDATWMEGRRARDPLDGPISVYEVHAGSWRSSTAPGGGPPTYRDLAHQLVAYVKEMGYTHIELLPILEHPFDGSWGYQVTGYYAPTARYGTPQDFMYFVDHCHQNGIGVLLDWVPAHFPKDLHGLARFDGSQLYEHADPRLGEHPDWGTLIFNFGRNQVRNFLIANALFWLDRYHIDGLRVDAVASMIYLDYSRKQGEWLPNRYGGRENIEALDFLRECNAVVHARLPHALTVAEESTAYPKVTAPVADGGLGFSLKWNMGWMHDILEYMRYDPVFRAHHHGMLTFSMDYAYSERFILALSHDEVVHVKGSLLNKMPGDPWQKFANLRALLAYMYAHPGKKLLFMGGEFGQWSEWNFAGFLDWYVLNATETGDESPHAQLQTLAGDLNALLRAHPALYALDFSPAGFEWIDGGDTQNSVIAFMRYAPDHSDPLLVVANFTPVVRYGYRVGVPEAATYAEILNTDAARYGGGNVGNLGAVSSEPEPWHGRDHSLPLTLPPLSVIVLRPAGPPATTIRRGARRTPAARSRPPDALTATIAESSAPASDKARGARRAKAPRETSPEP